MLASPAACAASCPRFAEPRQALGCPAVQLARRKPQRRPGQQHLDLPDARRELADEPPELPDRLRRNEGDHATDDDDRLDERDRDGRATGYPPREQVGQRAQQRGDQQADEHRDGDEVQPPQRDEHEVDGDGHGDRPPCVAGGDPQPVADGLVGVARSGPRRSAGRAAAFATTARRGGTGDRTGRDGGAQA